MSDKREEQIEEIEALKSIFGEDFTDITQDPPCFMVRLTTEVELSGPVWLRITFSTQYPDEVPVIEIPMRSKVLASNQCEGLARHLISVAEDNVGMGMVFTLVDEAQQWISDNVHTSTVQEQEQDQEPSEEDVSPTSPQRILTEARPAGGRWDFVIGLLGKPSAGKSTFFNAATTLDMAKTGAHPFTTIEPNIGKAFYSTPCPCRGLEKMCAAAYGHNVCGDRNVPVLLKDVAGLVPGAWEGLGRGNRFLNDLLDADVLVHILDVSGKTDEKGRETEEYDPSRDVWWIQQELHQWIYQNIMDKWDAIKRRPQKLVDMFTGYHATKATIHDVLDRAGIGDKELSRLSSWNGDVLHNIVTEFLSVRFPMLIVLNKCDSDTAKDNIERLQYAHPGLPCIPVSARSECQLQHLHRAGVIDYACRSNSFAVCGLDVTEGHRLTLQHVQENVLDVYGSTNVHQALCKAVSLKQPTYAFPVQCLDTLRSIGKGHSVGEGVILRDCISLKPGTTVDQLHVIMLHYPVNLLTGDFVRAETINSEGKKRPVKKDEKIGDSNHIIKIMTTRRSALS
ncbi:uncharacterized GTP-binding protein C428.15-like [Haliotis rufescens]|uniref:uncharacterized GTP-binding protein C428.15-like n=1 Tax=Haliotis rufescens TaxID=6454 RepID=UPI00201EFD0F|nr:uncharacterized GTP-binding protein C428.15-like [Haliotis rufescens]XP_048248058.1 uncharacterized GTP-binding protein C428.15-like [Haliotis rufescens]